MSDSAIQIIDVRDAGQGSENHERSMFKFWESTAIHQKKQLRWTSSDCQWVVSLRYLPLSATPDQDGDRRCLIVSSHLCISRLKFDYVLPTVGRAGQYDGDGNSKKAIEIGHRDDVTPAQHVLSVRTAT